MPQAFYLIYGAVIVGPGLALAVLLWGICVPGTEEAGDR